MTEESDLPPNLHGLRLGFLQKQHSPKKSEPRRPEERIGSGAVRLKACFPFMPSAEMFVHVAPFPNQNLEAVFQGASTIHVDLIAL